jgi:hypothetical protein
MKTAIYIEDGITQLIITPENDFEKNTLDMFKDKGLTVKIFSGSFYDCRGGWVRQNNYFQNLDNSYNSNDQSIMLRIDKKDVK